MRLHSVMKISMVVLALGLMALSVLGHLSSGADILVNDDGPADFSSIQNAIDSANAGDRILIQEGTYREQIHVDRSVSIIGIESWPSFPIIEGLGQGIGDTVSITADDVVISNLTIEFGGTGIYVTSEYVKLDGINCHTNGNGILAVNAGHLTIIDSGFHNNDEYGIGLLSTNDTTFENCASSKNGLYGLYLHDSHNNSIRGSQFSENEHGCRIRDSSDNEFFENTVQGNNGTGIVFISAHDNSVRNSLMANNYIGLSVLGASTNNVIRNNTFSDNERYAVSGNSATFEVDVENNWWNHPYGPFHPTINPFGQGGNVTDNVDFIPWLQSGTGDGYQTKYWYVDSNAPSGGNGSIDDPLNSVQDAIDMAGNGHVIYIHEGTYSERLVVDRPVDLIGLGEGKTIIRGPGDDSVISVESEWVNISGLRIRNGLTGIHILASNVTLIGNDCSGDGGGIRADGVGYLRIEDNICFGTTYGIYLSNCYNGMILGNNLTDNQPSGIRLIGCVEMMVYGNDCYGNGYHGIMIESSSFIYLDGNHLERNAEAGIYLNNANDNRIDDCTGLENEVGIKLTSSNRNSITDSIWSRNDDYGILLEYSDDNYLVDNNCSGNVHGIRIRMYSGSNDITGNVLSMNELSGLSITDISNGNDVNSNQVDGNGEWGIYLEDANDNDVQGNDVSNTGDVGIEIRRSDRVTIDGNTCDANEIGLFIHLSEGCTVENNIITRNRDHGISLLDADRTSILDNDCSWNGETGIILESGNVVITGNTILFNEDGIIATETKGSLVNDNTIYGNRDYGIKVETGSALFPLTATENWWGTTMGPYHSSTNVLSTGDEVSDGIDYAPWKISGQSVKLESDRYVDREAGPGGDGTEQRPFRSIQDAIDWARRGDTIRVKAGVYEERLTIYSKLRIIGDGPDTTIIDGRENLNVVSITTDDVYFAGFHVRNSSKVSGYAGIRLISDNNTLRNVVSSDNRNGIYPSESSSNLFDTVICEYNTLHGMTFGHFDSDRNVIVNSIFRWNGLDAGNGIHIREARFNTFDNCEFRNNTNYGIYMQACEGTLIKDSIFSGNKYGLNISTTIRPVVVGCEIVVNEVYGIMINSSSLCEITDNVLEHNGEGFRVYGSSSDNEILNNTIANNTVYGMNATGNVNRVDARLNAWGNDSGPYHPDENPNGTGNRVSDNVRFDPWLTSLGEVISVDDDEENNDEFGLAMTVLLIVVMVFLLGIMGMLGVSVFGTRDLKPILPRELNGPGSQGNEGTGMGKRTDSFKPSGGYQPPRDLGNESFKPFGLGGGGDRSQMKEDRGWKGVESGTGNKDRGWKEGGSGTGNKDRGWKGVESGTGNKDRGWKEGGSGDNGGMQRGKQDLHKPSGYRPPEPPNRGFR